MKNFYTKHKKAIILIGGAIVLFTLLHFGAENLSPFN